MGLFYSPESNCLEQNNGSSDDSRAGRSVRSAWRQGLVSDSGRKYGKGLELCYDYEMPQGILEVSVWCMAGQTHGVSVHNNMCRVPYRNDRGKKEKKAFLVYNIPLLGLCLMEFIQLAPLEQRWGRRKTKTKQKCIFFSTCSPNHKQSKLTREGD